MMVGLTWFVRGACAAVVLGGVVGAAFAGEIDPPSGPIAPTMKDLDDVAPRTVLRNDPSFVAPIVINASGSYVLGEDIQALPGQHAIEITVSDVTLDLNGFTIRGNLEVGSLDGIHVTPNAQTARDNIAIFNGVVRSSGGSGVNALYANNSRIERVRVSDSGLGADGGNGIIVGLSSSIRDCVVTRSHTGQDIFNPQGVGIAAIHGSTVSGCSSTNNDSDGISAGVGSSVIGCAARSNGRDGITTGNGAVVTDCAARENADRGIFCPQRCVVRGCTATTNTGNGIESIDDSSITDCVASDNTGLGIVAPGCLVRGNAARGNSGGSISAAGGSLIDNF